MDDDARIRAIITTYFESMFEADPAKVHAAFHPGARVVGYIEDGLAEMSVDQFADFVADHRPSASAQGETPRLDVLSLEIAGDTAVARVRDDYLGLTFLDTLTFLRRDDGWRIQDKLFHVEGPAGG